MIPGRMAAWTLGMRLQVLRLWQLASRRVAQCSGEGESGCSIPTPEWPQQRATDLYFVHRPTAV